MTSQPAGARIPEWTFGDRIRKIRRDEQMSQAAFAKVLGRGDRAVAAWEAGTNTPPDVVALAKRIEVAFGVPAAWTLGLNDSAPGPGGPGASGAELPRLDSNQEPAGYGSHMSVPALRAAA